MNEDQEKSKYTTILFSWILIWIALFIVSIFGEWIVLGVFFFPILICLFLIPFIRFLNKADIKMEYFKGRGQNILLGLSFMGIGLGYYFDEWDYKLQVHIPRMSGLLILSIGYFILAYALLIKSKKTQQINSAENQGGTRVPD